MVVVVVVVGLSICITCMCGQKRFSLTGLRPTSTYHCSCRQDGVEAKKKQAECLKKLGEIGLESGQHSIVFI